MSQKIVIIDYNCGNIQSVKKKINFLNTEVLVSNNPSDILDANKIILPGVGHFGNAMANLRELNIIESLNEAVIIRRTPILGICLGMQIMTKHSEEGNAQGLGWINGTVVRFKVSNPIQFKVPHMGWNNISIEKNSSLMKGIDEAAEFYFVHSYHFTTDDESLILNKSVYDYSFVSAFESENIFGVQYHPEKSHQIGERLITNFINL